MCIVSEDYGAANVTVTVEWTQLVGAVYNIQILPSVVITRNMNSCQLTVPYNTEYNLTVEVSAPCRLNTTVIRLYYGEVTSISSGINTMHGCSIIIIAKCGQPELLLIANDSVPNIEGYNGLPIEGSVISFSCPPGLSLIGPNFATCTETGEWEPDLSSLVCNNSKGLDSYVYKPLLKHCNIVKHTGMLTF